MKFESSQVIPFSVDRVFCVVRDDLQNLVPFMPNVKKIEVESVDNPGEGRVKLVNRWYRKGDIPKMIQKIIQPEMLTWLDTAIWDEIEASSVEAAESVATISPMDVSTWSAIELRLLRRSSDACARAFS